MNSVPMETYEKFDFEYTAWRYSYDILRQQTGVIKRQAQVEIKRTGNKAYVVIEENDDGLSRRAKKLNFGDIAFQLEHKGHFKNPWIYASDIEWWKVDTDRRKRKVLRHVFITRSLNRIPTMRVYFFGKKVLASAKP